MPNTISDEFRRAAYAQQTAEILVLLAVLRTSALEDGVLRLCDHRQNVTSNGFEYAAFPCQAVLNSDVQGRATGASVRFHDLSGEIKAWLREVTDQPTIELFVVRLSDPDVVESRTPQLSFQTAEMANGLMISIDLGMPGHGRHQFPYKSFAPNDYPGAF